MIFVVNNTVHRSGTVDTLHSFLKQKYALLLDDDTLQSPQLLISR